jgi:hypothetical protein
MSIRPGYLDLYDRFGCSAEHLKLTFAASFVRDDRSKAADRLAARFTTLA